MAVIALFRSAFAGVRQGRKQLPGCGAAPVARAMAEAHDESMTPARTARKRLPCWWGAIRVALCACALLVSAPASAEPGDDLPVVKEDSATPAASPASDDQVLTSPSLPSLPAASAAAPPPADKDPRALSDFEPRLSPYGSWVDDEKYGRIWVPDRALVGEGFSPYATGGHWALDTDGNWVWVSDYAFGDIVFHYGRWTWTRYGWSWVPGYRYAPAWVVWRVPTSSYAYVGWAPAPPSYYWSGGVAVSLWYAPPYYWVFCPSAYLFAPYPYRYFVTRPSYVRSIAHYTRQWVPPSRGAVGGPSLQAARAPSPATRVPAMPTRGQSLATARPALSSPGVASSAARPSMPASRSLSRTPTTSRTWSEPVRSFAPPARTFSPLDGAISPGARASTPPPVRAAPPSVYAPRAEAAPARVYAPPRAYSPSSRVFSPSPRVYSPSARTYSAPRAYSSPARTYSAPRVYAPARVYSAPAWHPSSFSRPVSAPHRR
jgi:hypothetical protein